MKAALLILLLAAAPGAAQSLAGIWLKDGAPYAEVRADGTATVDGDAVRWKADGKTLTLIDEEGEVHRLPYELKGDALHVPVDGVPSVLTRTRGKKDKGGQKGTAGKDELSALLLSSPWCFFSYNKISGTTKQERVVFSSDGSWGSGSRRETYSSGANGTVSGQSDGSDGGRWSAKGGRLLMSEGGAALEDVGLTVSRNSNGYPILNASGKEYSQCR